MRTPAVNTLLLLLCLFMSACIDVREAGLDSAESRHAPELLGTSPGGLVIVWIDGSPSAASSTADYVHQSLLSNMSRGQIDSLVSPVK